VTGPHWTLVGEEHVGNLQEVMELGTIFLGVIQYRGTDPHLHVPKKFLQLRVATGTEMAAELHRTTREVVAFGLDRIDPEKDIHITLIEAADRVLPPLPPRISDATTQLLNSLQADIRTKRLRFVQTVSNLPMAASFLPNL